MVKEVIKASAALEYKNKNGHHNINRSKNKERSKLPRSMISAVCITSNYKRIGALGGGAPERKM